MHTSPEPDARHCSSPLLDSRRGCARSARGGESTAPRRTRRNLRRDATRAEALLWVALRKHRLSGRKFRRQHSIGPYVLDFYCPAMRLAVELDGGAHDHEAVQAYDRHRETYLARHQIRVLRFINDDVQANLTGVAVEIEAALDR